MKNMLSYNDRIESDIANTLITRHVPFFNYIYF